MFLSFNTVNGGQILINMDQVHEIAESRQSGCSVIYTSRMETLVIGTVKEIKDLLNVKGE